MAGIRQAKRLLAVPLAVATGYYGALLARLSPERHQRFMRRRIRGPYRGALADRLMTIVDDLGRTQDEQGAMAAAATAIREALELGEFDRWIDRDNMGDGKATLIECGDFLPGRSWKLQLFFIPEGHSHPPHSHSDVASCLVVAKGKLHAREYNRSHDLERDTDHAMLSLASDRRLARGDTLLTTRTSNDVHWFGAVDGPAVAFNFQAVGFRRGRKPFESRRVYVDATAVAGTGVHRAAMLTRKAAKLRFAERPLSDFPLKS